MAEDGKKLENKKIGKLLFKKILYERYNFYKIINYYGLIEQVGSIFLNVIKVTFTHQYIQIFSLEINI